MRAGFGRKFLAWFIDGWIFVSLVPSIMGWLGYRPDANVWLLFIAFLGIRYLLEHGYTSPGLVAMSIDIHDRVALDVALREDAVSLGLGVVTILGGFQAMSIALGGPAPIPLFGVVLPSPIFAVATFSLAILLITAGYLIARVMMAGWWMVTSLLALWILSVLTGWQSWQELVVSLLTAKREQLGLGLRPGELEVLPSIAKVVLIVPASIIMLMLIGTRAQFKERPPLPIDDRDAGSLNKLL